MEAGGRKLPPAFMPTPDITELHDVLKEVWSGPHNWPDPRHRLRQLEQERDNLNQLVAVEAATRRQELDND